MTYKNENSYLSLSELKDLTRESNVAQITEVLRTWGVTPFVVPKTGFPVVFRDSLYKAQSGEPEFKMNLDAI